MTPLKKTNKNGFDYIFLPYYNVDKGEEPKRWLKINKELKKKIYNPKNFVKTVKSYSAKYINSQDFSTFLKVFKNDKKLENRFFNIILPKIQKHALNIESLFQSEDNKIKIKIKILEKGKNDKIILSKKQISCLLSNAFLCTFIFRSNYPYYNYPDLPSINFNDLFSSTSPSSIEKIKCIIHYFDVVLSDNYKNNNFNVVYERRSIKEEINWGKVSKLFNKDSAKIDLDKKIEFCEESEQVDFANKMIGGGILGNGCVQEEIQFSIKPELILSRLFTEELDDKESLIIYGCERFSNYFGYKTSFTYQGHYSYESTSNNNIINTRVMAIDATQYKNSKEQYTSINLNRDLNKLYSGFKNNDNNSKTISSGFWGAGVFKGDKLRSLLLQTIVASYTNRNIVFHVLNDGKMDKNFTYIYNLLLKNKIDIKTLYNYLLRFENSNDTDLFTYLKRNLE